MPTRHAAFSLVTPMIPTGGSLAQALAFYTGQPGFSVLWRADQMAGIGRDLVAFNLVENSTREWIDNSSFSIGVSDLDALYAGLPAQVGPLEMKVWGRREFHLVVASGVCP